MANTIILKRRIKTAQNVSKTTKAMQLIAASKLKRAQDATLSSRPYVEKLITLSKKLGSQKPEGFTHPYLTPGNSQKKLLIVLAPDKGLCGGLITNLLKEYMKFYPDENTTTVTVGKKVEVTASRSKNELIASFPFGTTLPRFSSIFPLLSLIEEHYTTGKVGSVQVLSNKFINFFSQAPRLTSLLPLALEDTNEKEKATGGFELFEPKVEEIIPSLLSHYVEMVLYQHLLESYVSEQAARMIAMQNATDNAKDIITQLTLEYNKARQEKITSELLDISGGMITNYA